MGKRNENKTNLKKNAKEEDGTQVNITKKTGRAAKADKKDVKVNKKNPAAKKESSNKQAKNQKSNKKEEHNKEELKFLSLLDEDEENNYELKANYEKVLNEVNSNINKLANVSQISKAVSCIKKYIKSSFDAKHSLDILSSESESFIYLNFVLGKVPVKYSLRPTTINLTNPLYTNNKDTTRVCLIVKDPRSAIKDLNIEFPFKVKIIDIEKLKLKYSRFNERRDLIKEYDIFLCDYKVYFLLKKLLGKPFYDAKKYPIPTKINPSDKNSILQEVSSKATTGTTFYMSNGPNYTLKIGRLTQTEKEIEENVKDAIKNTLPHLLKWGLDLSA
jgi:ribosome biogenesis protein UTP30